MSMYNGIATQTTAMTQRWLAQCSAAGRGGRGGRIWTVPSNRQAAPRSGAPVSDPARWNLWRPRRVGDRRSDGPVQMRPLQAADSATELLRRNTMRDVDPRRVTKGLIDDAIPLGQTEQRS